MQKPLKIRKALQSDFREILELALSSFGALEGPEIIQLINNLVVDTSAQPMLSLVATIDEVTIGHIVFSKARLMPPNQDISAALLAPLMVNRDFQSQGVGSQLVLEGFKQLSNSGVSLIFVLGYPSYYSRFGFTAAGIKGFEAPYPIPPKNAEAWMVRELHPGVIINTSSQVICANTLADPKYWRE